jgi:hypothetical protein
MAMIPHLPLSADFAVLGGAVAANRANPNTDSIGRQRFHVALTSRRFPDGIGSGPVVGIETPIRRPWSL